MRISDWSSDVCSSDLRLVRALALLEIGGLAVEIGGFDFRTGEAGLAQIVLGQKVRVLKPQALLQPAAVGIGLDLDRGDADVAEHFPQRQAVAERGRECPALPAHVGEDRKSVVEGMGVAVGVELSGE